MRLALSIIAALAGLYLLALIALAFSSVESEFRVQGAVAVGVLFAVWIVDRVTRKGSIR